MNRLVSPSRRGASGLTYAMTVGLIGVVVLTAIVSIGGNVRGLFVNVSNRMSNVGGDSGSAPAGGGAPPYNTSFTSHTFTPCGATLAAAPTQSGCNAAYAGSQVQGAVTVSAGLQSWAAPRSGLYRFTVSGGGGGGIVTAYRSGGARLVATKSLTQGTMLVIAVGQKGEDGPNATGDSVVRRGGFNGGGDACPDIATPQGSCAAGGGGSDVRLGGAGLADRIIVAGGGGGACGGGTTSQGGNGALNGANGSTYGVAGCAGKGGTQSAGGAATTGCGTQNTYGYGYGGAGQLGQGGHGGRGWGNGNESVIRSDNGGVGTCHAGGAGGGGGGWYGGSAGSGGFEGSGGGGSSNYDAMDASGRSLDGGANTGDGSVLVEFVN